MQDQDREKFGQLILALAELYEKELSAPVITMYFMALERYPIEKVERAFSMAVSTCRFFPKPVDILELIAGLEGGKLEDVAQIQADLVVRSIRTVGSFQTVKFSDPITTAVIQNCFGSWVQLCDSLKEHEEKWFRKDFVAHYQSYKRMGIGSTDTLIGIIESTNLATGHENDIPEPISIGSPVDEQKQIT